MKLTKDQIQELYKFTRTHFVEHYDLQTELVDHLANGIERQMKLEQNLNFKDPLGLEFKKFGVLGFQDVIRQRTRTMERKYWKIFLRIYIEFFRIPKIMASIAAILTLTSIFRLFPMGYKYDIFIGVLFLISAAFLITIIRNGQKYELEKVKLRRKWILKDQIYALGNVHAVINLFPITLNFRYFRKLFSHGNVYEDLFFANLIVGLLVFCYVGMYVLPQKAEELLSEIYLEYKMT